MSVVLPLYNDADPPEPVPDRWLELSGPTRRWRSCSVQAGWRPLFTFEAWLDTGYEGSRFEYTFGISVGPWRFAFDWRPVR